jgi:ABC transport system ATP-binding/permease protein
MVILALQAPLFAALIVLVYGRVTEPGTEIKDIKEFQRMGVNIIGIHFLMVIAAIWFGCNNAARDIVGEWTVFQRERMVNLKLPSYIFSKFGLLLGLCTVQCLLMFGIVYFGCHLRSDWVVAVILVLASLIGAALGLAISSRSTSTESAIALLPVVLLPIIALGGGLKPIYRMPDVAQWASYAIPSRLAFEYNVVDEATNRKSGYPAPTANWKVDAADVQVPITVDDKKEPARPDPSHSRRFTLEQTLGVLGAMLAGLLASVFVFLKIRDPH